MTTESELSNCLSQVPYLQLEAFGPEYAEFHFRGALGRLQRCELGLCVALSFPPRTDYLAQAHHMSLLLAASEQTLDFGLQRNGDDWLLWRRFETNIFESPETVRLALDNLLALMRFLHGRFSAHQRRPDIRKPLAIQIV